MERSRLSRSECESGSARKSCEFVETPARHLISFQGRPSAATESECRKDAIYLPGGGKIHVYFVERVRYIDFHSIMNGLRKWRLRNARVRLLRPLKRGFYGDERNYCKEKNGRR